MTNKDRAILLEQNINWRACVEQVAGLLAARNDEQIGVTLVWLIRWLNDDERNIKRTQSMTLESIIEAARNFSA